MENLATLALSRRVDRLLEPWRGRTGPGVTVGVARHGEMVLHRSAGLANIDHEVTIGPATTFRIASVSKQFTCAAILMLAADGALDVQDEARTWLPDLPDVGHRVTVAHLMHNSAGVRDMFEVLRLGGSDLGQPVSPAQMTAGIHRQRALNFAPGSRYLYSNSNFWLLGLIVEKLSGMNLPAFLENRIFAPLGMAMTRMTPSTLEPVRGLATGYAPHGSGGWHRAPHAYPLGGEGGLVSSVIDLAIWDSHLATAGAGLHAEMVKQHGFPNGEPNGYARGLQIGSYRGVRTESHGGLWPGYKTQFLRVPEHGTVVIAISNDATADPYHLAQDVLDMLLDGKPGVRPALPMPPRPELERWPGRYLDRASGATVDIELTEAGRLVGRTHGVPFRIVAAEDGWMRASRAASDFKARFVGEGLEIVADAGHSSIYARVAGGAALPDGLAGRYTNPEIAAVWSVTPDGLGVHVAGPVVGAEDWTVMPVEGDCIRLCLPRLLFDSWLDVRVARNAAGDVTGLLVDGGRARGLVFQREAGPG